MRPHKKKSGCQLNSKYHLIMDYFLGTLVGINDPPPPLGLFFEKSLSQVFGRIKFHKNCMCLSNYTLSIL